MGRAVDGRLAVCWERFVKMFGMLGGRALKCCDVMRCKGEACVY